MDEFIVKQLKNLKRVRPSTSWLESQRSFLLSEISKEEVQIIKSPEQGKKSFVFPIFNISKLFRPAFGIALVLIVFASSLGTVGIISAAQNSLPGDILYVLKTAVENTQMSFAGNDENKVKLSIKFANQRIDEFKQIADQPEKISNIEKTVQNLTDQLVVVQDNMARLKEQNISKAAEVAKLINDQTASYKETLITTGEQLAYLMPADREKLKVEIDQALIQVNKTQEKADEIIKSNQEINNNINNSNNSNETIIVPPKEEQTESPSIPFEKINQ